MRAMPPALLLLFLASLATVTTLTTKPSNSHAWTWNRVRGDGNGWNARTFTVYVGLNDDSVSASIPVFVPGFLKVRQGDVVVFEAASTHPHTVTFFAKGKSLADEPLFLPPTDPRLASATELVVNPVYADASQSSGGAFPLPSDAMTASTSDAVLVNSGLLAIDASSTFAGSWNVSFPFPGKFTYTSVTRRGNVMTGVISVLPRTTPPGQIPSPSVIDARAQASIQSLFRAASLAAVRANDAVDVPPTILKRDGTYTRFAVVGSRQYLDRDETIPVDFYGVYPRRIAARIADTVVFSTDAQVSAFPFLALAVSNSAAVPPVFSRDPARGNVVVVNAFFTTSTFVPTSLTPQAVSRTGLFTSGPLDNSPSGTFSWVVGVVVGDLPFVVSTFAGEDGAQADIAVRLDAGV